MSRDRTRSPDSRRYRPERASYVTHDRKPYDRDDRSQGRERHGYHERDHHARYSRDTGHRDRDRVEYGDARRDRDREPARPSYRPVRDDAIVDKLYDSAKRAADGPNKDNQVPEEVQAISEEAGKDGGDDEEAQMAAMMGFGGFGTTKGRKVQGNAKGAVAKPKKKTEYRQYMNRPGGFNRELSPS